MSTDVLDNVESFNIAKFIPTHEHQPFHPFFEQYRAEIEDFSRVRHTPSALLFTYRSLAIS